MSGPAISGVDADKIAARRRAKARRHTAVQALTPDDHLGLAKRMRELLADHPERRVAAYWPLRDEADPWPGLTGHPGVIGLPVVVAPQQRLIFREWKRGDPLVEGPFGTRHPELSQPEFEPDIVIVPMLAFDADGGRLGYGGGYYDRTLTYLRSRGAVMAIGLAWEGQLSYEPLPTGPFDQPLDALISESQTRLWKHN